MEKITVEVTQADIAKGVRRSLADNPVALAWYAARQEYCHAYRDTIRTAQRDYALPESATEFLNRFHEGERVDPITFELSLTPTPTARPK